jgi:hypothetical protein
MGHASFIEMTAVPDPTASVVSMGCVVGPVDNPTLGVPCVFAGEFNLVSPFQILHAGGDIEIMGD